MNSLPPTLSNRQLAHALAHIETLAKERAADDVTARKIWNICRGMREDAEAQEHYEYISDLRRFGH